LPRAPGPFVYGSAFARLLRHLSRSVCRHPRRHLYPQIALALLAILWTAHRLKLDMNRDDLVGPQMRYHRIYMQFQKEFPGEENELAVVAESSSPERNREFIERLAARIESQTNLFADLFYKADLTTLGPKGLLLFPTNGLAEMQQSLHAYRPLIHTFTEATNLDSLFGLVNRQFRTATVAAESPGTLSLVQAIPFLQSVVVQARNCILTPGTPTPPEIESLLGGSREALERIYITFQKGRFFLLTLRPRSEALTASAIERLRSAVHRTQLELPGVDVGVTGGPALDYDEMRQSEHDSIVASCLAMVLCSAIFIIAYREVFRPLKAAFCLLLGLGYSMGFTTLAIGHLNILTITFAPILIGLAIDFGVHFITRFEEERRKGRRNPEAIERATAFTGQGIVTGAFTTAAAFLAMALTHFKGIQEMGIISGGGLLLCLVPMMTALPALLLRGKDSRRPPPRIERRLRLERLWIRHSVPIVVVTVLLTLAAALRMRSVHFDYNLLHMQSPHLASVIFEQKLIRAGEQSALYGSVVADSLAQARAYEAAIKRLPVVSEVDSAADFFGPGRERKLALARAARKEVQGIDIAPTDPRPVRIEPLSATLWYLSGYLGLAAGQAQASDPALADALKSLRGSILGLRVVMLRDRTRAQEQLTKFQQIFFSELRSAFTALKNQDTSGPLRPGDLPPALRDRFIGVTGHYLLQVYSRKDLWDHANQREFIHQLDSVVPPDRLTGTPVQLYEYTTLLKNSYLAAAGYALAAIAVMVLLHFRSLLSIVLALLPVVIGTVWLLGFLGVTGMSFNPANIMTLPLVVGIGVTNGIQILNRFAEEQQPSILARSTGKAVLVSGLTTIAGFGSLIPAQHEGIRSLGIVMSVGIAACMVAGLGFLPALLNLLLRKGWSLRWVAENPA
jgi:uncharacterized protein